MNALHTAPTYWPHHVRAFATMDGWQVELSATHPNGGQRTLVARALCATWVDAERMADTLVRRYKGTDYTAIFQGKGWSVELRTGYRLWSM